MAQVPVGKTPPHVHAVKTPSTTTVPGISLPSSFQIQSQDDRLKEDPEAWSKVTPPPLGVLASFTGKFEGTGLNMIFRPNSGQTQFTNPLPPPAIPNPPNENVLELNLTTETLSFAGSLGSVPNRGLEKQTDIFLNGVPYAQSINDVTNTTTGKGDYYPPSQIHFEPGLWMHIPATNIDPVLGESLTRMASIPHGTTINAQCLEPTKSNPGPPPFKTLPPVDITPFNATIGKHRFAAQTADAKNTPRLPQDLTKFIDAKTITQEILDNPNLVLFNAIQGQNILNSTVFTVSTIPKSPEFGGGVANIAFLQGGAVGVQSGPNAVANSMSATFWIEEVEAKIEVPPFKPGHHEPLLIKLPAPNEFRQAGPTFRVNPPYEITTPKTISVTYTQIQYMQTVILFFAKLSWPHVSCATLIPADVLDVPATAFHTVPVAHKL